MPDLKAVGIGVLPTTFTGNIRGKQVDKSDFAYELMKDIGAVYGDEILQRPLISSWTVHEGDDGKYKVVIGTPWPLDEINPKDLKQLTAPIGDFEVELRRMQVGIGGGYTELEELLMKKIEEEGYGRKIRERPFVFDFIVQEETNGPVIYILITKPVEELQKDELQKLQEPVIDLPVKVESKVLNSD